MPFFLREKHRGRGLDHETEQLKYSYWLQELKQGDSIYLRDYTRTMISDEENHISEVEKMLRKPE